MRRCLELAESGLGKVAPNPMVGSVLVYEGRIVGEGFHKKYGGPHAEVHAINSVKDKSRLADCTLYVNLEPCVHKGKTPPCSDLIIEKGIKKVVIGTEDPNAKVAGNGIKRLRKNGVEVIENVLPEECKHLNRRFFTYHKKKRPYVILKWAQTADGFIDVIRTPKQPIGPNWISNALSQKIVHKWRSEENAILAGTYTFLFDNPRLNVRQWPGSDPVRVAIDRKLKIPSDYHIFNKQSASFIFNSELSKSEEKTDWNKIPFDKDIIPDILSSLYESEILSVIIEGGKNTLEKFIHGNYWDEARVFVGPKEFGEGLPAPTIYKAPAVKEMIKEDELKIYYR